MHDIDQPEYPRTTPNLRLVQRVVRFWKWAVIPLVMWLTLLACNGIKANFHKWSEQQDKLPHAPTQWVTTREVTIKYRVIMIDGAEYILAQDLNGREVSLCPKVK